MVIIQQHSQNVSLLYGHKSGFSGQDAVSKSMPPPSTFQFLNQCVDFYKINSTEIVLWERTTKT
jgi:hypothetical protein